MTGWPVDVSQVSRARRHRSRTCRPARREPLGSWPGQRTPPAGPRPGHRERCGQVPAQPVDISCAHRQVLSPATNSLSSESLIMRRHGRVGLAQRGPGHRQGVDRGLTRVRQCGVSAISFAAPHHPLTASSRSSSNRADRCGNPRSPRPRVTEMATGPAMALSWPRVGLDVTRELAAGLIDPTNVCVPCARRKQQQPWWLPPHQISDGRMDRSGTHLSRGGARSYQVTPRSSQPMPQNKCTRPTAAMNTTPTCRRTSEQTQMIRSNPHSGNLTLTLRRPYRGQGSRR
jgi:hypothetical protein